ncbi:hypothetical protein RvY_16625-2 [Ramazzottius varieornatus]|nr:hypothetical protein RvY_16625-2 [Ramazzottius varieornatus]
MTLTSSVVLCEVNVISASENSKTDPLGENATGWTPMLWDCWTPMLLACSRISDFLEVLSSRKRKPVWHRYTLLSSDRSQTYLRSSLHPWITRDYGHASKGTRRLKTEWFSIVLLADLIQIILSPACWIFHHSMLSCYHSIDE